MDKNLNWNEIKKIINEIINKYLFYCLSIDYYSTSVIEDKYLIKELKIESMGTNFFEYGLINNEERSSRLNFINHFRISFNKLPILDRKIIYFSYLDTDNNYDDSFIANTLGYSLGYYYILKKKAIIRFAFALSIDLK